MKKILIAAVLFLAVASTAKAGSLDVFLSNSWDTISASQNFHLLDNGAALVFKDINHGVYYGGLSTNLYTCGYVGIDFLAVRPMNTAANYLPGAGVNLRAGHLMYDKIPFVKAAADYIGKAAPLISNGNIAFGGVRDFSSSKWIVGIYGSLVARFGPGGK